MLEGREMEKRRGNVKGRGMVKGDGEGKGMVKGDGEGDGEWKGMEKRRGMVKGRAYLGPCRHSLVVLDPCYCLCTCVLVVLLLGHVTSSLLCVAWLCCCSALALCCLVIVVACLVMSLLWLVLLISVIVLSLSHRCAVFLSLPSHVVIVPHVVLCLSKVGWEEWRTGGAHCGVLTTTMNNDIVCCLLATLLTATWHLALVLEK